LASSAETPGLALAFLFLLLLAVGVVATESEAKEAVVEEAAVTSTLARTTGVPGHELAAEAGTDDARSAATSARLAMPLLRGVRESSAGVSTACATLRAALWAALRSARRAALFLGVEEVARAGMGSDEDKLAGRGTEAAAAARRREAAAAGSAMVAASGYIIVVALSRRGRRGRR
jgi:hypothetical protein